MVTSITNLGRSGLYDWVIQRATAVILAVYTLFLLGFIIAHPDLLYSDWQQLFANTAMKIASLLALVSICAHGWIGMWTIATDYIKPTGIRLIFLLATAAFVFVYLVWGIDILWGA
ncbi:MAG: succinate dehydrogenase / fumarate reductase membrane anchor subunit [Oleispira sp.]|jgi:succinate dehydrogenase / fumarate reductase membrane anchor subunit